MYSGGAAGGSDKYLGTFTFRASTDASGTFTLVVRMADMLLRDSSAGPIDYTTGDAQVTVQVP